MNLEKLKENPTPEQIAQIGALRRSLVDAARVGAEAIFADEERRGVARQMALCEAYAAELACDLRGLPLHLMLPMILGNMAKVIAAACNEPPKATLQ